MNRIEQTFARLKDENRTALVTYVAAGDPDRASSQKVLNDLPKAGADIVELGMCFSDPMADGPVIQAATRRALDQGNNLKETLEMAAEFRKENPDTPLVLMGYFNPIFQYGCEAFIGAADEAGIDGLIIVDLPPEESEELAPFARDRNIDLIRLVTPVTDETRLDKLIDNASGFLYYVSITGVTGTASADTAAVADHIQQIKSKTDLPIAVGFGIKTPDDVRDFKDAADAIVVGSAIVQELENDPGNAPARIAEKVKALRDAM